MATAGSSTPSMVSPGVPGSAVASPSLTSGGGEGHLHPPPSQSQAAHHVIDPTSTPVTLTVVPIQPSSSQYHHHSQVHHHHQAHGHQHQGPALHHQQQQQQPSPSYPQPSPWTISEATSHCVQVFERLRSQREQSRFADLILSVQGREFPAHRCVLAACSPWFDARLKVHKNIREHLVIEECKDYEIFYALLTYCYTGNIVLDSHNVPELLSLAFHFQMVKLKSYCIEYLIRNLNVKNVHVAIELAFKFGLTELIRRCFSCLQRNFPYLFEHDREELMRYTPTIVQAFVSEKGWTIHPSHLLKFITSWVNFDVSLREESFQGLLYGLNWAHISPQDICDHLEKEPLYQNSPDALLSILTVTERHNIYLGQKFQGIYQSLQERILPDQDLDELNDSNSFLSLAINSAVKDLEHSVVVDTDFFLQNDPFRPPQQQQQQHQHQQDPSQQSMANHNPMGGHHPSHLMPPPPPGHPHQHPHHHQQQLPTATSSTATTASLSPASPVPPPPPPSSGQPSVEPTMPCNNSQQPQQQQQQPMLAPTGPSSRESVEKYKDFELDFVEQLINEQQQSEQQQETNKVGKYRDAVSSIKRYDPKYRALTEAFRQMEDAENKENNSDQQKDNDNDSNHEVGDCVSQSPEPEKDTEEAAASSEPPVGDGEPYPHPKQRHLSSSDPGDTVDHDHHYDAADSAEPERPPSVQSESQAVQEEAAESNETLPPREVVEGRHNMPARVFRENNVGLRPASISVNRPPPQVSEKEHEPEAEQQQEQQHQVVKIEPSESSSVRVESKKKLASKERRAKAMELMMKDYSNATLIKTEVVEVAVQQQQQQPVQVQQQQNQHVKKAKLLAEHREKLQRSNSQEAPPASTPTPISALTTSAIPEQEIPVQPAVTDAVTATTETLSSNSEVSNKKYEKFVAKKKRKAQQEQANLLLRRKLENQDQPVVTTKKEKNFISLRKIDGHQLQKDHQHRQQHQHYQASTYACPFCDFVSEVKSMLKEHIGQEHCPQSPPFDCGHPGCQFKAPTLQSILNHQDVHVLETVFKCNHENCGFIASTIHRLKFHKISHSKNSYPCQKCPKRFQQKQMLVKHQLVHANVKALKCPMDGCDFRTKYRNHLVTHMKIHRGEVFKCSVDPGKCQYSTPKRNLLIAHERAHKKEKNFKCNQCDKAFVEKSQLTRHEKIHSDEKPFACQHCPFKSKRKDKLKSHVLKKHKPET